MDSVRNYLSKHASGDAHIEAEPENGLKYIVVLPAYLETRLEESLVSLFHAAHPGSPVEVLVVINWPENESPENIGLSRSIAASAHSWAKKHSSVKKQFHVFEVPAIPRKKAGVGFARKTGMDEAVRRFLRAGQNDGIILSFDADTTCEDNYLTEVEKHFLLNPTADGCSVYFEHPLEGNGYSQEVYRAITQYELHMRCYLHSIRHSGYPNAYYTVGSAMAVRAESYCRQGGMNVRQAGEDFYFLQKFFDLGNFTDLLGTSVFPSPRPSLRVPFGTGKTIDQLLKSGENLKSYNPAIYEILKDLFELVPRFYEQLSNSERPDLSAIHKSLRGFLNKSGFTEKLVAVFQNSGSFYAFSKRFYRYFNMFRVLKFVNYARTFFPDIPVGDCAKVIAGKSGIHLNEQDSEKEILIKFRQSDRGISVQQ